MQTSTCYSGPRNDVCSFLDYTAKQWQILGQFSQSSLLNMPRNIILKIIKLITWTNFKSPKTAEMAKNAVLLDSKCQIITPFSHLFANHLQICQETSYWKIRKIHSLEKISSPKNCENDQKRAKNCHFLALERQNLLK